jgi:hypothetical protein
MLFALVPLGEAPFTGGGGSILGTWVPGPSGQGAQGHPVCNNVAVANCIPTGANCECTTGHWLPDQENVPAGWKPN